MTEPAFPLDSPWEPHHFNGQFPVRDRGGLASLDVAFRLPYEHSSRLLHEAETEVADLELRVEKAIVATPEYKAWRLASDRLNEYVSEANKLRTKIEDAKKAAEELIASGEVSAGELLSKMGGDGADVAQLKVLDEAIPAVRDKSEKLLLALFIEAKKQALEIATAAREKIADERDAMANELCNLAGSLLDGLLKADEVQRSLYRGNFSEEKVRRFIVAVAGKLPDFPGPATVAPSTMRMGMQPGIPPEVAGSQPWEWIGTQR